ncbi:winged helix-turn-helix domain-containing protein [Sphingomonas sp. UYP23]
MHEIGSSLFDPVAGVITKGKVERKLEDRAARVLAFLCRHRGELVSKDQLLTEVWSGRSVSPNSVAIVIGDLRRALDDDPGDPAQIVTVGKRGYRLTAAPAKIASPRVRLWRQLSFIAGIAILASAAALETHVRGGSPLILVVMPTRNETGQSRYDALARALETVVTDRAARLNGAHVLNGAPRTTNASDLFLKSRLILWNGAPELALTAIRASDHSVVWSAFATSASGNLAEASAHKLDGLQSRLGRTSAW